MNKRSQLIYKVFTKGRPVLKWAATISKVVGGTLMLIWVLGRLWSALTGVSIFPETLTYYLGLVIWLMVGLILANLLLNGIAALQAHPKDYRLWLSWIGLFVLIVMALVWFKGYRIGAIGFYGSLGGMTGSAQQGYHALARLYPLHPVLPVNFAALFITGSGFDLRTVASCLLRPESLMAIYIAWVILAVILFFFKVGRTIPAFLFLLMAVSGVLGTMQLKVVPDLSVHWLLHLVAVLLLLWMVLMIYNLMRKAAQNSLSGDDQLPAKSLLPPRAVTALVVVLVLLPLFADLHNQFSLEAKRQSLVRELHVK